MLTVHQFIAISCIIISPRNSSSNSQGPPKIAYSNYYRNYFLKIKAYCTVEH
jgi:hypothetical protein